MIEADRDRFLIDAASCGLVPMVRRVMSDQVTPVLAYRRLVSTDTRESASFLLESVEVGGTVGRHSIVGAGPMLEVSARKHEVTLTDHRSGSVTVSSRTNPLELLRELGGDRRVAPMPPSLAGAKLPGCTGGWFGYAGYDTVRYMEPDALPFEDAPEDDRGLPDMQFGLYR
ncbi:MAG TPA: hypothetical protein DEO57_06855, partial [Phycisphaerales bacterium]|nr:hypothetical protein [Phycisphaerales bacterium]